MANAYIKFLLLFVMTALPWVISSGADSNPAAPTFTPPPGTYTTAQSVTLTTTAPNAQIRFTTDQTLPTASSPLYAGPLTVDTTTTIKARAFVTGNAHPFVRGLFAIEGYDFSGNATTDSWNSDSNGDGVVDTPYVQPASYTVGGPNSHGDIGSNGVLGPGCYDTNKVHGQATANANVPVPTVVYTPPATGYTDLPVIAGNLTIAGTGTGSTTYRTPSVAQKNKHALTVSGTGTVVLYVDGAFHVGDVVFSAGSTAKLIVHQNDVSGKGCSFNAKNMVGDPNDPGRFLFVTAFSGTGSNELSLNGGAQFGGVVLAPYAGIKFNGNSDLYGSFFAKNFSGVVNGNFKFHYDEALAGFAWGEEAQSSPVATATYVLKATPPTATPAGGIFSDTVSVALSSPTPGATIHYTLDGTVPTGTSPVYAAPVVMASNATLSAIARKPGWADSEVMAQAYAIQVAAPIATPAAGNYDHDLLVTLSSATSDAVIRYTTDGSAPTAASTIASGPIPVTRATVVTARAERVGCTSSINATFTYGFLIAPVSITPGSGNLSAPTHVTLATTTPQAVIRYTVDGSDPTPASPLANGPVLVDQSLTLKAVAYRDGWTASAVSTATYVLEVQPPDVQAPIIEPASGTYSDTIPVTITTLTTGAAIHYSTDGSQPTTSSPTYSAPLSVDRNTTVRAIAVVGSTASTTSSATYAIQVAPVTANVAPGVYAQAFEVMLGSSTTGAVIRYTLDGSAPSVSSPVAVGAIMIDRSTVVTAIAERDGCLSSPVSAFAYQLQATPPVIVPVSGTYTAEVAATITTTIPGAIIRYTLDGSLPADTAVVATGPVTIDRSATLTARVFRDGWLTSDAATAVYHLRTPAPVLAPAGGSFTDTVSVVITSPIAGVVFRATTDGSDPTLTSPVATSPITIERSQVLAVIATRDGWLPSTITTGDYDLTVAPPVPDVVPGRYEQELAVSWTSATNGATIRYTTDGSEPTESSPVAVGPVPVTATQTLRARAFRTGCTASATTTATYELKVPIPVLAPAPGIYLATFSATITNPVASSQIRFTQDGSDPTPASSLYTTPIAIDQATTVTARAYRDGWISSDPITAGYQLQVQRPILNPESGTYLDTTVVELRSRTPGAVVRYAFDAEQPTTESPTATDDGVAIDRIRSITAIAFKDGWIPSAAVNGTYVIQVATPTPDVVAGAYDHELSVTWTSTTTGAIIRYTLDGSEPTPDSPALTGPLAITTSAAIKTRGFRDGCAPSETASVSYELKVPAPTFTPGTGDYNDLVTVAVGQTSPAVTVRYTVDGSTPGDGSPVVPTPLIIATTGTQLTLRAFRAGWTPSDTASATYTLKAAPPVLSPGSTTVIGSVAITASTATPSAQIRYTSDGSQPTATSTVFPASLTVTTPTTLMAQTYRTGFLPSAVVQATYNVLTPGSSIPPTPVLRVTYRTNNSIAIAWELPPIGDGLPVVSYEVQVKQSQMAESYEVPPVNGVPLLTDTTGQTTWTHTDLYSYESSYGSYIPIYEYAVTAIDQVGNRSALSNWVWAVPMQQPTLPLQLRAENVTSYAIDLAWYPSYFYYDYLYMARYVVKRNGSAIGTIENVEFNQLLQPTFTDLQVDPSTPYVYVVEAYDGYGPPVVTSEALTVTTIPDYPYVLMPPTHLTLDERTDTRLSISWRAPSGVGSEAISGYEVFLGDVPVGGTAGVSFTITGLPPGSSHVITVASRDGAGNRSAMSAPLFAATRIDQSAPGMPTNLRQTAATPTTITLAWNYPASVNAIVGFGVYRNGDLLAKTTDLTYIDTGLKPSTTYTYAVATWDVAGHSSLPSPPLAASTLADTQAPAPPSNLQVAVQPDNYAILTWTVATDNSGIAHYDVFRHGMERNPITGHMEDRSGFENRIPGTSTSYKTQKRLYPVSTVGFSLIAVDLAGNQSIASQIVYGTSGPDITPPSPPPQTPTATHLTLTSVTINWGAYSSDEYRATYFGDMLRYDVIRDGVRIYSRGYHITGQYRFTDLDLEPGRTYRYHIDARDVAGNVSSSGVLVVTTALSKDPLPPSNLTVTRRTETSFSVRWEDPNDPTTCAVRLYEVLVNGTAYQTESTSLSLTGLSVGTPFVVTVRAIDIRGVYSADSLPLVVRLGEDQTAPMSPGTPDLVSKGQTAVTLHWSSSTDNVGVVGYEVLRDGIAMLRLAEANTATDVDLLPNRSYGYAVRAFDAAGNHSRPSNVLRVTTLADDQPPSVPTGLTATDVTTKRVVLRWSGSTDDIAISGYQVLVDGVAKPVTTATEQAIDGLLHNTTYHFAVRALDANGNRSAPSDTLAVTTSPDIQTPSVPTDLTAFFNYPEWLYNYIIWEASTDDSRIAFYKIYRDGALRVMLDATDAPASGRLGWHDALYYGSLNPGIFYTYQISAVDVTGKESPLSEPAVTVFNRLDLTPPKPPTNLVLTGVDAFTATFQFELGSDGESGVRDHIGSIDGIDRGRITINQDPFGIITASFRAGGFYPATTHTVTISAIDWAGNRSTSLPLVFTTDTLPNGVVFFRPPSQSTELVGNRCELSALAQSAIGPESGITYSWSLQAGPAAVQFSRNDSNDAKVVEVTFTRDGHYVFLCTASDPYGTAVGSTPVLVEVIKFAQEPVVTPNPVLTSTAIVSAAAYSGIGLDDQIVYSWRMVSGPAPVTFSSNDSHEASASTVTFAAMGSYTLSCTASLPDFTSTRTVVAENTAMRFEVQPTMTSLGGDNAAVRLSALAHMGGVADSEIIYAWSVVSGPGTVTFSANGTHDAASTLATVSTSGTYVFGCVASWSASPGFLVQDHVTASLLMTTDGITANAERSPLAKPVPFDPERWSNEPGYRQWYLAHPEPGRIWQSAAPGAGIPALQAQGTRRRTLPAGLEVDLAVRLPAESPVTFTCISDGTFTSNGLNVLTTSAGTDQMATARYLAPARPGTYTVMAASPLASGTITFVIVVPE